MAVHRGNVMFVYAMTQVIILTMLLFLMIKNDFIKFWSALLSEFVICSGYVDQCLNCLLLAFYGFTHVRPECVFTGAAVTVNVKSRKSAFHNKFIFIFYHLVQGIYVQLFPAKCATTICKRLNVKLWKSCRVGVWSMLFGQGLKALILGKNFPTNNLNIKKKERKSWNIAILTPSGPSHKKEVSEDTKYLTKSSWKDDLCKNIFFVK